MARRRSRKQDEAIGKLILFGLLIGLPVYLIVALGEKFGWPMLIGSVVAVIAVVILLRQLQSKAAARERTRRIEARRAALLEKYGDMTIVDRVMSRSYWQGQTTDQLRDSLGEPDDVDEKVMKAKSRQVWKYQQTGANRFGLRITVENGLVVGWDEKL